MKKIDKIKKIGIQATKYPDWDYVIDNLVNLAEKMNEIIDFLQSEGKEKE